MLKNSTDPLKRKKTRVDVQILIFPSFQCAERERKRKETFKKFKVSRGERVRLVCVCDEKKHVEEIGEGEKKMRNSVGGWGARMVNLRRALGYRSTLSRDP